MIDLFWKRRSVVVTLAFALAAFPAHATKWASASLHTTQPINQVFEPTENLIASKEWYIGTRWHIQAADPKLKTIQATTISFGQQWGEIYVWMTAEGTGTCIHTVMTLDSAAHLHPADYAARFGKALKKLFPDLTYEIERDKTPTEFYFGSPPVSIPLTPSAVASQLTSVSVTQNVVTSQVVQIGSPSNNLFSALADWAAEQEASARQRDDEADAAKVSSAAQQVLTEATPNLKQYLATIGKASAEQFPVAAQAINDARDAAYKALTNPFQRAKFVRITNEYMLTFERQMGDHAKEQASAYQEASKEEVTDNLHRALDFWYANGKDWTKIPPETWNKLSERDKGRLKDGVDPELGRQVPNP
jgi:hypothetical protein